MLLGSLTTENQGFRTLKIWMGILDKKCQSSGRLFVKEEQKLWNGKNVWKEA